MVKRLVAVILVGALAGCGGGGGSPNAPAPPAATPTPAPTPPPAAFGPGQHLVNSRVAPGRYFADPVSGCYWERLSGLGGTTREILANDFVSYDARQIIVDIVSTDLAFEADTQCGSWYTTPRHGPQITITPGMWLVGTQITAGTYQANVGANCYWERLRHFEGSRGIIANDFISTAGPRLVTISASDVGFSSDADCGTWAAAAAGVERLELQFESSVARAWTLARAKRGLSSEAR